MQSANATKSGCHEAASRIHTRYCRHVLPWLGFLCIAIIYVVVIMRLSPTNYFGMTEDDSIYFSSAKALAEGKGYVMPSVPGAPPATKYPILYPWLLSWVWRWNPSFPANLVDAVGVTVAFGLGYLTLTFLFLRKLKGIGEAGVLFLTAFCALHPVVLFHSSNLLSDIPFAAVALGAMLVADDAIRREGNRVTAAYSAVLVGLSMLLRVFGVPVAAGIFVAGIVRRAWRQLIIFCGCVVPFFVALAWRIVFPTVATPPAISKAGASSLGWTPTWAYYTSYLSAWKTCVPTPHIFWTMIGNNALTVLLRGPASYFLFPALLRDSLKARVLVVLVTAAIVAGVVKEARQCGWKAIHYALPFYLATIVIWPYPNADRFLLPFLPLLAAGLWLEGRYILRMISAAVASHRANTDKLIAGTVTLLIVAFGYAVAWNYIVGLRKLVEEETRRSSFIPAKRAAYEWLLRTTSPEARVIANEDVYLYTGRTSMRPFVLTTAELYDSNRLQQIVTHMGDVPEAIGAQFWMISDDDLDQVAWPQATLTVRDYEARLRNTLPEVFRSGDGRVSIYSLDCLRHREESSCRAANLLLLPRGY